MDLDELQLKALKALGNNQIENYMVYLKNKNSSIDEIRFNQGSSYAIKKLFDTIDNIKRKVKDG